MAQPLLAQSTGEGASDTVSISDSGIGAVTTEEWILAAALIVAAIVLSIVVRRVLRRTFERMDVEALVATLLARFGGYLVVVVGFFYAMSTVDVRVGPILGALGIGGIALAFALQEILSNFVSGILLQIRRPFVAGDEIVSGEHEGVVEQVDLRVVQLRTFDGERIYIPNSQVLQNPITNWTATPTRRTTLEIGITYSDDLAGVQRAMLAAIDTVDAVEANPAPQAFVYEFGESSINFAVRFWHDAEILAMWRTRDAVAQAIKRRLDAEGYTIPFPQRTLWFGPDQTTLSVRDVTRGASRPPGADPTDGPCVEE
ncbi:MAG: mechanosensitive ion channel family protein [Solirubrobacteraceae bacterium]